MNYRLTIALSAAVLGATIFVSSAGAQMRGVRVSAPAPRTGVPFRSGARSGFVRIRQHRVFPGSGFLSPYFYPGYDYDYEPFAPQEPPPPPPQAAVAPPAPPPVPAATPAEPLVLEYQGGQWVRVASYGQLATGEHSAPPGEPAPARGLRSSMAGRSEAGQPPLELPPAVLVFRDGHQEEVEKYTIMGGVIYTSADYWSTGSWTRKVPIAELNLPATLKQNQERGGKFTLPSGPNEIVIRP